MNVLVGRARPFLATAASGRPPPRQTPFVFVGEEITDLAILHFANQPTGTVTFRLYGPNDEFCSGPPLLTSTKVLAAGSDRVRSDPYTPTLIGLYRWIAVYSGDANNFPSTGYCDDQGELVSVIRQGFFTVSKSPSPSFIPEPGGTFTFTVTVINGFPEPVEITSLVDDVHGDLNGQGTCMAGATVAPNGGTYTCSFPVTFTGPRGSFEVDNVTVLATAASGPASASDGAEIRIAAPIPQISVTKAVSPATLPEPGGTFTYTITVTNLGVDSVPVVVLRDDVYGDLNGQGTCATGTILAPNGGTYTCAFLGVFTGNAGATLTDTVHVGVQGPESAGFGQASATVSLNDVPPTVSVAHGVVEPIVPEPGGQFYHRVTVTNTSGEPVTIASLGDDVYGDLTTRPGSTCTTARQAVLPPGGTYACSFTATFTGEGGASQTDTAGAAVVDDEGSTGSGSAPATVVLSDAPPRSGRRPRGKSTLAAGARRYVYLHRHRGQPQRLRFRHHHGPGQRRPR